MSYYNPTRPTIVARPSQPEGQPVNLLAQAFFALVAGVALFLALLVALPVVFNFLYAGRIFPGVSVGGIDLSGMSPDAAASLLAQRLDYPDRGQIAFQDGPKVWIAHPRDVGLFFDYQDTAQSAFMVGREGGVTQRLTDQLGAWRSGVNLAPRLVFDERMATMYMTKIAAEVDKPIIEASLSVNGIDVSVRSGQVGRATDVAATLPKLEAQLGTLTDGIIPLVIHETPPVILDATQQAEAARRILSAPLTLTLPDAVEGDPGPWTFDQQTLAKMLTIERVEDAQGAHYQVALDPKGLRPFLTDLAPKLEKTPQDARFTFNDETRQLDLLQHAVIGRNLDVDATLKDINDKLTTGEHSVALHVATTSPQVTDSSTAEQLGIKELVSSQTTYFYGSTSARIQNIKTASSRFHGLLVPPGATFSMADVLGDVSLDNGYAEALIIYGNRTIKGVGGGVCQVSTTLFRTVFFGGYPVIERNPHAYRVGYYEQTASGGHDSDLAGMDATVFVPVVDFKFKNDSTAWLLMETYVDGYSLTWKFYSTSDGRKVEWNTTGPENTVDPPDPLYEENPDLAKGEIIQVDYEAQGADITVTRTVTRDGEVLYDDTFTTHYLPWRAVFQYGPGTKHIPTPAPTDKP